MRSLILCEGRDEVYILGYYLFKTSSWMREKSGELSDGYVLPRSRYSNQIIDVYKKEKEEVEDLVAIWGVGGKDNFTNSFEFLEEINRIYPKSGIEQVFILLDRAHLDIEECLVAIGDKMRDCGLTIDN